MNSTRRPNLQLSLGHLPGKTTLAMTDELFQTLKSWDSELALRYYKFKIGLTEEWAAK